MDTRHNSEDESHNDLKAVPADKTIDKPIVFQHMFLDTAGMKLRNKFGGKRIRKCRNCGMMEIFDKTNFKRILLFNDDIVPNDTVCDPKMQVEMQKQLVDEFAKLEAELKEKAAKKALKNELKQQSQNF